MLDVINPLMRQQQDVQANTAAADGCGGAGQPINIEAAAQPNLQVSVCELPLSISPGSCSEQHA